MKKRHQIIDGVLTISIIIPLGPIESEKLEDKSLRKKIDTIAKDLHVNWAVEQSDTEMCANISRTFGIVTDDNDAHDLETAATNFMTAVEKLTLPESKKNCPKRNNSDPMDEEIKTRLQFVHDMLNDWDKDPKTIGADIIGQIGNTPFCAKIGRLSGSLLKECLQAYIITHE